MTAEKTKKAVVDWAKRFQCPVDEDANYKNTFWCNRDLIPIPDDRRTWTWQGFAGYWVIAGWVYYVSGTSETRNLILTVGCLAESTPRHGRPGPRCCRSA